MTTATMQMFSAMSLDMSLQRSFAENKERVMRAFGLTGAEQSAVKFGDEAQIKKLIGGTEPVCFVLGLTRTTKAE